MKDAAQCGLGHLKFSHIPFTRLVENLRAFPKFALPDAATLTQQVLLNFSSANVSRLGEIIQDRPASTKPDEMIPFMNHIRPYFSYFISFVATNSDINHELQKMMTAQVVPCNPVKRSSDWNCNCMDPLFLGRQICNKKNHTNSSQLTTFAKVINALNSTGGLGPWLKQFFNERRLLFVKVTAPAHCYHSVLPLFLALQLCLPLPEFRNIIFCTADENFELRLQALSQVQCGEDTEKRPVYFIIHPECLCMKDSKLLKNFIQLRRLRTQPRAHKFPRIFVISSLSASFFGIPTPDDPKPEPVEFKWNDQKFYPVQANDTLTLEPALIREFAYITAQVRTATSIYVEVSVFRSDYAGAGKTRNIMDLMKKYNSQKVTSYYLDLTTDEIPHKFESPLVHFQLSPDLFGNDFRIWDQLFLVTLFGFYLKKDSNFVDFLTPFTVSDRRFTYLLLMEVPVVKEGSLMNLEDFPIGLSNPEVRIPDRSYLTAINVRYRSFITVPEKRQDLSAFKIEGNMVILLKRLFKKTPP
jgi:hypothetical protein